MHQIIFTEDNSHSHTVHDYLRIQVIFGSDCYWYGPIATALARLRHTACAAFQAASGRHKQRPQWPLSWHAQRLRRGSRGQRGLQLRAALLVRLVSCFGGATRLPSLCAFICFLTTASITAASSAVSKRPGNACCLRFTLPPQPSPGTCSHQPRLVLALHLDDVHKACLALRRPLQLELRPVHASN